MGELFLKIFNMSIAASWLILAIFLLRLLFKKSPKAVFVALWGIAGLRLILPFSFESIFSLVPSAKTIPSAIITDTSFEINSGIPPIDNNVNNVLSGLYLEGVTVPFDTGKIFVEIVSMIWIVGIVLLLCFSLFSFLKLRKTVSASIEIEKNIFVCDEIQSPFILGMVKPKIYLSSGLSESEKQFVIAHEKTHLKRLDRIWKPIGFLVLVLHWFNPFAWLAFNMLCKDIELACDEKLCKNMSKDNLAKYSRTLLNCSKSRKMIFACPIAFGEVGVKQRIKSILNYKKPALPLIIILLVCATAISVCFLTNPKSPSVPETGFVSGIYIKDDENADSLLVSQIRLNLENQTIIFSGGIASSKLEFLGFEKRDGEYVVFDSYTKEKTDHTLFFNNDGSFLFDGDKYWFESSPIDAAIHDYLVSNNHGYHGEINTEGHIILGVSTEKVLDGGLIQNAYVIFERNSFAFENDCFVPISASRSSAVFTIEENGNSEKVIGFKMPKDGADYQKSITKLFPSRYRKRIINRSDSDLLSLWKQCVSRAAYYLQSIGRSAKICRWGDLKHPLFTDFGMPVEISNKISDYVGWNDFYEYIGSKEIVENGTRYVYKTSIKNNNLVFQKIDYESNTVVKEKILDIKTGTEISGR